MSSHYATKDIKERFNITDQTVRAWSAEFARHLSEGAKPAEPGKHRRFTFEDMEVFTLVAEMKSKRLTFDDIHASLDTGERGIVPIEAVAMNTIEQQRQLTMLTERLDKLQTENQQLKLEKAAVLGKNELLEKQLSGKDEQIVQLRIQIHELQNKTPD